MRVRRLHSWLMPIDRARRLQERLARRVILVGLRRPPRFVAGADASFNRYDSRLFAGVCVIDLRDFSTIEEVSLMRRAVFPYVPGLLSFREAPPVLDALQRVKAPVDAVILDGQGLAHPRFLGLASHVGLFLDVPTIGCAKSLLVGEHAEPARERGSRTPLTHAGRVVGTVLRTRDGVKPLYVSPGNRMDIEGAAEVVLACTKGCRIPEPIRRAHQLVNEKRRAAGGR